MSLALCEINPDNNFPDTPGGRKMQAFLNEVEQLFDRWSMEKTRINEIAASMTTSDKTQLCLKQTAEELRRDNKVADNDGCLKRLEEYILRYKEESEAKNNQVMSMEIARSETIEQMARHSLYNKAASMQINARFNPYFDKDMNKGYCTASIMGCLKKCDRNGELDALFNVNPELLAHPATLFKHLNSMEGGKYQDCIYRSGENGLMNVEDIITHQHLKPGALVCLTIDREDDPSLDGNHNHLVIFTGKDKEGKCCFTSFNNDEKDGKLKHHKSGYVCDTGKLVSRMIRDYHRVCTRGGYIESDDNGINLEAATPMQLTSPVPTAFCSCLSERRGGR